MKNVILGMLIMWVVGLYTQNEALRSTLAKQQSSVSSVAKKGKKARAEAPVKEIEIQTVVIQAEYDPEMGNTYRDPRCPKHSPYWDARWGCLVKRP